MVYYKINNIRLKKCALVKKLMEIRVNSFKSLKMYFLM